MSRQKIKLTTSAKVAAVAVRLRSEKEIAEFEDDQLKRRSDPNRTAARKHWRKKQDREAPNRMPKLLDPQDRRPMYRSTIQDERFVTADAAVGTTWKRRDKIRAARRRRKRKDWQRNKGFQIHVRAA